jgi:hypothetical protein
MCIICLLIIVTKNDWNVKGIEYSNRCIPPRMAQQKFAISFESLKS